MYAPLPENGKARLFMVKVCSGLNHALSLPGRSLILAHGGVHWAICCLMGLKDHNWSANNCDIFHFSLCEKGNWTACKLT
jgi:probable phosphoglycerate mutase